MSASSSDRFDLDPRAARQRGDAHGGPRRIGRPYEFRINLVDDREVAEVDQIESGLDDVLEAETGLAEHGFEILHCPPRFLADAPRGQLAAVRVQPDLARAEEPVPALDCLSVGADRRGSAAAAHRLDADVVAHAATRLTRNTPESLPMFRIPLFKASAFVTMR